MIAASGFLYRKHLLSQASAEKTPTTRLAFAW
jgi:hypothetical protein